AAVAPQKTSLAGSDRARAVPSQATLQRPVIARRAPAAPVVPFEQRAEQLRRNPGQPLARAQVQTLRESTKVAPVRSRAVRVVGEASQRVERATAGSTPAARSLPRGTAARDEAAAARRTDPAVGRAVPARTPQADG